MAVRVSHLRDFTRPEKIERRYVEWGIGCTPRKLAPEWAEPGDPLVGCARNGSPVEDWDALLNDGDHVHFWARPGIEIAVGSALLATLGNAILFSLYGFLLQKLLAPTRKPTEPGDDTSTTYAFNNLRRNLRGEGGTIPVVYGRTRVTPYVINEYIASGLDAEGNPTSEYRALYLIGEGPVYSIGGKTADGGPFSSELGNALTGLKLNDQPASNFAGVEAHVRLGNTDQTAISEFTDVVLTYDVDKVLRDSATLTHATGVGDTVTATTAIAQAGPFSAGDINITKWDAEETFTGDDDADEFTVVLEFPRGLVSYNTTTSAAEPEALIYQVRYREVDGGGTPFGNYIVLPAQRVSLTRSGPFRIESKRRTYDPAAYFPPIVGKYLEDRSTTLTNNTGAHYTISGTFAPAAPANLQLSIAFWAQRRSTYPTTPATGDRYFHWVDVAGNEGVRVSAYTVNAGTDLHILLEYGTGSTFASYDFSFGGLAGTNTGWHHFAIVYEATATGSRGRLYIDGALKSTGTAVARLQLDSGQVMRIGSDSHTSPTRGARAHFDEFTVWSRALSPYEVSSLYNGGLPFAVDADAPGLIIGGRWDTGLGPSPNIGAAAFGPYVATDRWIFGSGTNAANDPTVSASAGIVYTPETGTPKRGKWLVEVMRLDSEDTVQHRISEAAFDAIQWRTFQQYEYPGVALLAVKVPATDQLSGGAPVTSVIVEGKLVPVWDGVNADYPNMPLTYSRSQAWIAADAALNRDYGLGGLYDSRSLDVAQFQALAAFCDQRIYDGYARVAFSEAAYRDSTEEFVLGPLFGDVVRYKVATLPAHFPSVGATSGYYIKPVLTGLSPAPPTWLTNQAALAAQEIVFVNYSGSLFNIYTRTTLALGPGQTVYTVSSGSASTNGLEGHDVRYRFDGVFDRADFGAWDAIIQILQTARASPVRIGSRLSVFIDDEAAPVALIGMGSIVEGTWEQGGMGVGDRPNAESSDINDELLDFERVPVSDEHPEINNPANQSGFRWRRVSLEGITREAHAKRHLRRDLNTFHLVREWCSFELGIDALPLLPGDIAAISHDVPQVGFSGRMYDVGTNTTVKLDRQIVLTTGWQIQVEDSATGAMHTVAVTHAPGTYAAGTALTVAAFPGGFIPAKDDEYAIGQTSLGEAQLFRLVEATLDPRTFRTRTRWLEYNPDVFADDFGTLTPASNSALPVPRAPVVPSGVENLTVTELTTKGPDGAVITSASVSFTHQPDTFSSVGGSDVYIVEGGPEAGYAGAIHKAHLGAADTTTTLSHPFARNQTYTVWVVPRARDGSGAWASWASFTPSGLAATPLAPANVRANIVGDLASYQWDDPGDIDLGAIVEARRGGWILGQRAFEAPAQARSSGPTADWADVTTNSYGFGTPEIVARVKLRTGQYSPATIIEPTLGVAHDAGAALVSSEEDLGWA